jgi:hypothetical protein
MWSLPNKNRFDIDTPHVPKHTINQRRMLLFKVILLHLKLPVVVVETAVPINGDMIYSPYGINRGAADMIYTEFKKCQKEFLLNSQLFCSLINYIVIRMKSSLYYVYNKKKVNCNCFV